MKMGDDPHTPALRRDHRPPPTENSEASWTIHMMVNQLTAIEMETHVGQKLGRLSHSEWQAVATAVIELFDLAQDRRAA